MKWIFFALLIFSSQIIRAESLCDVRVGQSLGINVVEFASGKTIHSKMALKDTTPQSIAEEMGSLQDMGICAEKIITKKCVLRFEKKESASLITMFRGTDRWISWTLNSKSSAQNFVKSLKRIGFCS